MKAQIEALHSLQAQDRRLVSIERKLGSIPRRKQEMEQDLGRRSMQQDGQADPARRAIRQFLDQPSGQQEQNGVTVPPGSPIG